ncbi:protein O-mannosyl-transferase family [Brachyspira pilosicoli]|uniref:protein O-mannosyl-transferase family n=1 Tax=Brachyspira pilosicoli TaxID=52584 RepID=UPI003007D427
MAKLSHLEKEYIKANYKNKSIDELTKKLEKDRALIEEYVNNLQNNQKNNTNKKEKTNKEKSENIFSKLFSKSSDSEPIFKRYEIKPYHLSKIDIIFSAIAFLFTFLLYLFTLTPSLSAGDNGELTTAAYFLGVGHAPGYPFYTLMSKLFTYIPFGNIAWRTNLFSGTCGAIAMIFFYLIMVKVLGQNRIERGFSPVVHIPALLASVAFAISDNMWAQATMAEVYSLNILQIASMLLILVYWFEAVWQHADDDVPYYGNKYLMAFGFLYGVALANHHVTLPFAFAPLLFIAIVLFLVHKDRYIENIETPFISIFVFLVLLFIGGFGYYRFIMNYEAYLYFPPGVASNDSIFSILFKPFTDMNILSDIFTALANGSYLRPDMIQNLKAPFYPTLYKGMFLVFWPLFLVVVWVLVYRYFLCKIDKFNNDNDFITGISFSYYKMLLMLALGVMIYAYMPIRARALPPLNWGQLNEPTGWENLSYLFSMIHRKQYGASGNDIAAAFILHPEQVTALINIFKTQLTILGLLFLIPGLFQIFKKNKFIGIFSVFGLLSFGVSLMAYTNPPPSVRTLSFVEVFFLPATLYMIVIVGFGIQWYMEYFNTNIKNVLKKPSEESTDTKLKPYHAISLIAIFAIMIPIFVMNFSRNNNSKDFSNHDYSYNMMNSLPDNAIFATEGGDNQVFGLVYYTMVERRRPDLKIYDQKGNVFERIYGNLMKTDGRWLGSISDAVDKDFIDSGRPYYMAWRRDGLERLGDYYFKAYGLVFKVQPIKYALVDELEFFKVLTVNDYKAIAKEHLKRNYENEKVASDLNALLDEGLISVERKNNYNGNEEITFVKMYELPFPELKTEEDYWNSYTMKGTAEEISHYDFLTREIFVSSYSLAKIDMYNRRIKTYQKLLGFMGNGNVAKNGITREEANAKIEEYKNLKREEEERMLTIGFDMSNVYFAIGNQAILDGDYERATVMYEELIKLEKLIYPAYFNLAASYEYLARSKDTPYEKEAEYLNKAKDVMARAEKTFHRGKDIGDAARAQNTTYQQIMQFNNRLDLQLRTTRQQADALKQQAIAENTFDSYTAYANYIYQNRQDLDETIWAKTEAKKRAVNNTQLVNVNKELAILYANIGDVNTGINILNETLNLPNITVDDRRGVDFDLASIYLNQKRYNEAINIYSKYTNDLTQDGAFALYAIGHIYIEQNMIVEALNVYNDFKVRMSPLAKDNQVIANLDKDVESRRVQIMQYLGTVGMPNQ